MSHAPDYTPSVSFADDESNQAAGRSAVRTEPLDTQLANISASINALNDNLKLLQRDDDKLRDLIVEPYALSEQTRALMAAGGRPPRGEWAPDTLYDVGDLVQRNAVAYMALVDHNSGPTFNLGFWMAISGDGSAQAWAEVALDAQSAAEAAAAAAETDGAAAVAAAAAAAFSQTAAAASALAAQNAADSIAGLSPVNLSAYMLGFLGNNNAPGARSALGALAATFATQLADTSSASNGAGIPGFNRSLPYGRDSVGGRLAWDIYVTDYPWSAVGDGSADDTTALAAAVTFANALADIASDSLDVNFYPRLIFPQCEGFRSTATLSIRGGVEVIMHAPLLMVAAAGTPIIGIDYLDANGDDYQGARWTQSKFNIRRVTQSTWPGETDIGLRVVSHYCGKLDLQRITGFHVGASVCAGYEEVDLGEIRDCKIGLLVTDRSSPDEFTNQTHFHGGSFACSGTNAGVSRYGIEVRSAMGGINTLAFSGQSYELGLATAQSGNPSGEAIPVVVNGTAQPIADLRFIDQRSEVNSVTFLRATGDVSNVECGILNDNTEYSDATGLMLDDQSTGSGGIVVYRQGGATSPVWETFFDTGRLAEKAVQLTGSVISIQNLECATNVGAAPATQTFNYGNFGPSFDASGFMTCAGPFYGVRVRLNGARSIAISGKKPSGQAANLKFICFDSSGVQITAAGAVKSYGTSASVNTSIYGGIYSLGLNPANTSTTFNGVVAFSSTVATVFVTVESPTSSWCLKRSDARPDWFSATSHLKDQFVGAAIPIALTNVTYKQGMRVAQITSAVGSPKGWVCTVPGVPTFVSEGNL